MAVKIDLQNPAALADTPAAKLFSNWVEAALLRPYVELEQTIRIVDAEESRALNHQYRDSDRPTNVLAFPADDRMLDYDCLGDLVICAPVVVAEARDQGKAVDAHWAHLVVHGMLHLQGHEHQDAAQAERMERMEIKILDTLGYTNPYND